MDPSPQQQASRQLSRRLFDATIVQIPVFGSYLQAVWSIAYPDQAEILRREWEKQVNNKLEDMENRIDAIIAAHQPLRLSDLAVELGCGIARDSTRGRAFSNCFLIDDYANEFSDHSRQDVKDAIGELASYDLVKYGPTVQRSFISATYQLFLLFDPIVFGDRDPNTDAVELSKVAIEDSHFSSPVVADRLGFEPRRFNVALTLLMDEIGNDGAIFSRENSPDFKCNYFLLNEVGRARLKRKLDDTQRYKPIKT